MLIIVEDKTDDAGDTNVGAEDQILQDSNHCAEHKESVCACLPTTSPENDELLDSGQRPLRDRLCESSRDTEMVKTFHTRSENSVVTPVKSEFGSAKKSSRPSTGKKILERNSLSKRGQMRFVL